MSCQGCNDTALPLVNCNDGCEECGPTHAVGLPPCPQGEACEEIANTECLKYTGPNFPALGITNGIRLKAALAAMNYAFTEEKVYKNHTITVTTTQSETLVEYQDKFGALQSKIVTYANSPQTICALVGTPVIMRGTGTIVATNVSC